ncbi:hypothetical protein T12_15501 [Trichinella patagoniensis]|uniref:Uncharacterized protein n=1 Tax=Trichinella patagoniensis TaxID=990121 RepID=A0A0V0YVP5_9BILA|nr:hypothetical protein T12_15501 [Trichinella patagoniensis]
MLSLHHAVKLKIDFSNYSASCTQRTFYNATTCHVVKRTSAP